MFVASRRTLESKPPRPFTERVPSPVCVTKLSESAEGKDCKAETNLFGLAHTTLLTTTEKDDRNKGSNQAQQFYCASKRLVNVCPLQKETIDRKKKPNLISINMFDQTAIGPLKQQQHTILKDN